MNSSPTFLSDLMSVINGNLVMDNTPEGRLIARLGTGICIDSVSGCWNWTKCPSDKYGKIQLARKNYYVHRLMYSFVYDLIPIGMEVCHRCDNPKCCNPNHLFPGTKSDNMQDMYNKGRGHTNGRWKRGEKSHLSKITDRQVAEIRQRLGRGESYPSIAKDYGVSRDLIGLIKRGHRS